MGWEVGERLKREGTYVYLWLVHVDLWQKPTQYCKAIIFQSKINNFFFKKNQQTRNRKELPQPSKEHLQKTLLGVHTFFCSSIPKTLLTSDFMQRLGIVQCLDLGKTVL